MKKRTTFLIKVALSIIICTYFEKGFSETQQLSKSAIRVATC